MNAESNSNFGSTTIFVFVRFLSKTLKIATKQSERSTKLQLLTKQKIRDETNNKIELKTTKANSSNSNKITDVRKM